MCIICVCICICIHVYYVYYVYVYVYVYYVYVYVYYVYVYVYYVYTCLVDLSYIGHRTENHLHQVLDDPGASEKSVMAAASSDHPL